MSNSRNITKQALGEGMSCKAFTARKIGEKEKKKKTSEKGKHTASARSRKPSALVVGWKGSLFYSQSESA